ncbi:hypothetical protein TNCV_1558571 [Trichonephila clavipes]|uniref:Uncharacterized protein n=1 Tax=Trichonephila clavipes TaxID=2585209 RepID=A0A8X6RG05_TRICX|nr:hypothetical protein TNCV_1558571 [Trichonephila clavipes]
MLEPQLLDIMIVQFRNEEVSNHGSIPITIDCNVVAFIVFEEGFHQPIKRTKQSVFLNAGFTVSALAENDGVNELLRHCRPFVCSANQARIVTVGKVRAAKRLPRKSHTCSMG